MRINPENVLKKLEEYRSLQDRKAKLHAKLVELNERLNRLLGCKGGERVSIWMVMIWLDEGGKLTQEDFLAFVRDELRRGIDPKEVTLRELEEIEETIKNTQINVVGNWEEIKSLINTAKIVYDEWERCKARLEEVFGLPPYFPTNMENLVKLIYKCLKYAVES